jgi:hypothetical protein
LKRLPGDGVRSVTPQQPCLDREHAIAVFEQLIAALLEVKRLRGDESPPKTFGPHALRAAVRR